MKNKEHSEFESSSDSGKDQQMSRLWIGLILFVSGWMFFLGVLVGRGSMPALFDVKKIETELAELAKSASNKMLAKNVSEKNTAADPPEGDFHKTLKEKTDTVPKMDVSSLAQQTKQPETVKPAEPSKTSAPVKPVEPLKTVSQETPRLQATPAPKPVTQNAVTKPESIEQPPEVIKTEQAETKIKSLYEVKALQNKEPAPQRITGVPSPGADSKPPGASQQQVSVQLTGLLDKKSADTLIENLRIKGITASKSARMIPEKGIWYRIVIEKIPGSNEADAIMNRLKQDNIDANIVKR